MTSTRPFHSVEILESRIAPAAVTFSFIDKDGTSVLITSSKGTTADLQAAVAPLTGGTATDVFTLTLGSAFKGADISVVAGAASDTIFTRLGFLDAHTIDLGNVTIDGELDRILAGDKASATPALKTLTVGAWGNDTAPVASELDSVVTGAIGALTVKGDFTGGYLRVKGSDSDAPAPSKHLTDVHGKIGTLFIGGSVEGTQRDNGGHILATGDISNITVAHSVNGFVGMSSSAVVTPSSNFSGRIFSGGAIKSLVVGTTEKDGISGGDGDSSGQIGSVAGIGSVTVNGTVRGGGGTESGTIGAGGSIDKILITGDLLGGDGPISGAIGSFTQLGTVVVNGDVQGGGGSKSGAIVSKGTIKSVTIGNLIGGDEFESGVIGSLKGLGPVVIHGNIVAGSGERSGLIATQEASRGEGEGLAPALTRIPDPADANAPIASVTVDGSIIGHPEDVEASTGYEAGGILSSGRLGPVSVAGGVFGGGNSFSGRIESSRDIVSVTIGGPLQGGVGYASGSIYAGGALGPVKIGSPVRAGLVPLEVVLNAGIIGDDGPLSGSVVSGGPMKKVEVFGDVLGGDGPSSGVIETQSSGAAGDIGAIFISKSLIGSFGSVRASYSGQIYSGGKIGSVTIGDPADSDTESGNIIGGIALGSGSITSSGDLVSVKIKISLIGGTGDESGKITSGGKLTSLTVGSPTIVGSIIGGIGNYDTTVESGNQLGQVFAAGVIGSVSVSGDIQGDPNGSSAGGGRYAAQIRGQSITTATIGGGIAGGLGAHSAGLFAQKNIGTVTVQYLDGGGGAGSGFISAEGDIGSVTVRDSIAGGGFAAAGGTLGTVNAGSLDRARISAGKMLSVVNVVGSAYYSNILAGYSTSAQPINGDAQIGTVTIGTGSGEGAGFLQGTNIVAGLATGEGGYFGRSGDHVIPGGSPSIFSKIASVIVRRSILDTSASTDSYGIVAQQLVSLKVGGVNSTLTAGALTDFYTPLGGGSAIGDTVFGEKVPVD